MTDTKYYIRRALVHFEEGEALYEEYLTYYNEYGDEVCEDGSPIGNKSAREDEVIEIFDSLEEAREYLYPRGSK